MNTNDAKEYLARRDIPQLFESLLNGLMCSKPEDPIEYLESCLQKVKELGGCEKVKWDTFVSQEKKTLPPLNGGQSRRSFLRNVMPENSNFPYRRYDRLPPIHQFSIESDTDLSETAELIEEYEVFDPTRPRPKIILVIGGPGSGKGTQSLKIAERYGFQYISVGELLRKKIHSASSNRKWSLIAKIITNGELAPQETTITEIKQKLMQIPDEEGIVIDGFPRDVAQALSFEDQICTPDLVVFLACASQRLRERLAKRAEQQGRPDDNLKATQRRLGNFKQNAAPLVKYFQEKGLIVTFDADRDEDAVFYDISVAVDNKLFPNKEAATDSSDLDPSMMFDPGEIVDTGSDYDDQGDDELDVFGEGTAGGGPGSGKGTQCEKLAEKYGFTQLSTGELLRQELASESERSRLIRDVMERGDLVPSDIILELLKEAMVASLGNTKGFLIDGYPREVKQGEEFGRRIGEPHLVICMDCSADTMTNRLLQRSQSSQRGEDTARTIAKRLEAYHRASIPVISYYETKTQLRKCELLLDFTANERRAPAQLHCCLLAASSLSVLCWHWDRGSQITTYNALWWWWNLTRNVQLLIYSHTVQSCT
ncbi:Adenylate kinase isoenzyme 5 [Microtus ochrogaster]|uniref:Adenylate kinase isoenzyme 5 n=1 Tax=Microtus ochrogaster TaxID=79684 RepID=A0A8J6GGM5_MICOH|nr:Adenylate kinase isoenzyme 5 [Microtus ochrogaster]